MRQVIHKAIAERIACELGFSKEDTQIFVSGSIGPDSHADFPHATGHDRKIMSKIDTARTLFLQNDEYSYGELANALHYIRDKWTRNPEVESEQVAFLDDDKFLLSVEHLNMPKQVAEEYLSVANVLLFTKKGGIESWFDHSWGIWHRDYSTCVYVFADVLEMMLPTLQPDISITGNKENLKVYIKSEAFKNATQNGFFASVLTNFVYPKLTGYAAAMYSLASISPPANYTNAIVDLNISYRLSLEIARYTLLPLEQFKYSDSWTHGLKDKNIARTPLTYVLPQYHVLIPKPWDEVNKERLLRFDTDAQSFLAEWSKMDETLPVFRHRSKTWIILFNRLVEMLRATSSSKM
jgi:hypothetical protein